MRQRLFWPCIALSGLLAACSSNNSAGFVPGNGNVATPGPGPSAVSQSGTVNAASGGTVSVPFAGGTAQVTIPAGAVAQNGAPTAVSVTLTALGAASQLGQAFASEARATASTRKSQSLPTGAQFISAFAISVTGGQLVAPLKVSIPVINQPTLPNSVARLAIYNPKPTASNVPSFFDIDTATISGGNVSNDVNPQFVSVSVGPGLSQPYVYYGVPAPNAATPAPITLTITPATPGPFAAFGQTVVMNATGADANGNALAFSPTFALDNAALGVLAPLPGGLPASTSFTTGSVSVAGNVTAVDPRTGAKGALALKVQTQRPATKGDSYTYLGTLTQVLARNYPTPNPASVNFYPSPYPTGLTQSVKSASSQVVSVSPVTGSTQFDFKTVDTETYNLLQTVTTTDAIYGFPTTVSGGSVTLSSITTTNAQGAKDPLAYTIAQVFATPQIADILPEVAGAAWVNSGASTLTETDPDGTSSVRTYAADGSYVENTTYPQGSLSSPAPAPRTATITVNGDGSGSYNVPYAGLPNTVITFGTPQPAPSGGLQIPINVVYPPARPGGNNRIFNVVSAAWYGASPTLYAETNTNVGSVSIPSTCVVPPSFGTKANAIAQQITRTDPVIGYIDQQVNVTYDVLGFGTVCVTYSDVNTAYYDYTGAVADQLPFRPRRIFVASNGTPISVTTTTQVLGLQSATVAGASASRLPQSLDAARIYVAKSAFQRKIEEIRRDRVMSMFRNVADNLRSTGGQ